MRGITNKIHDLIADPLLIQGDGAVGGGGDCFGLSLARVCKDTGQTNRIQTNRARRLGQLKYCPCGQRSISQNRLVLMFLLFEIFPIGETAATPA